MTDTKMTIRTMINGLKDIPSMTDKRQVARRVRGLILALKDLQKENKYLTKMTIRNAHQRDTALARLSRAARKNRKLEAKHKRLRARLRHQIGMQKMHILELTKTIDSAISRAVKLRVRSACGADKLRTKRKKT